MRILHLTSHLHIGGISRYVLSLTQRLRERGHRVIIASDGGPLEDQPAALGAAWWRVPLHTSAEFSPRVFRAARELAAHLREEPVDVIHAHTRVAQVVADRLSQQLQIPYVTTWHGIYKRRLGRRLWPCTGAVTIAISEFVRQHLLHDFHLPEQRVRCIYNGIDVAHYAIPPDPAALEAYRQRWQLSADQPVIGNIGRLASGRVKGFDTLLAVARHLQQTIPDLQVLVVGDGPRRPFLEEKATHLNIRHQVRFTGAVDDIRIPLALMDLFIFTSRWPEGFGLTLVEAMAAGKAVVATYAGAVPEVIEHNVNGWLVPSEDPTAMAEGITRLLDNRAAAAVLGVHAQATVRERFSLDRMADEVEAVYHEVLHHTPHQARTS